MADTPSVDTSCSAKQTGKYAPTTLEPDAVTEGAVGSRTMMAVCHLCMTACTYFALAISHRAIVLDCTNPTSRSHQANRSHMEFHNLFALSPALKCNDSQ